MPQLKKSNEILDLDAIKNTESLAVLDLDQIKDAQISIGKLVQSMTIPVGEIQAFRALVAPPASVIDAIKEMKSFAVSVEDTHKAFVKAFAPTTEAVGMIGKIFKQHAEEFQRVADIGSIIRAEWIKTIEETNIQTNWQQISEQLQLEAATHVPALRQEYEAIVDDLPLSLTFTIPKVTATYTTEPVTTEEAKGKIIMRSMSFLFEMLATNGIQKDETLQFIKENFVTGFILESPTMRPDQLCWDGIILDFRWASLQYRDFQSVDISPETQAIKWLRCIMEKQGELATNIELALATGLITPLQAKTKTNREVARSVQLIKKQVVTLLWDAGMTQEETERMIQSKRNIGFILRKITTAKLPQK